MAVNAPAQAQNNAAKPVTLPSTWQIQPAKDSKTEPDAQIWGTIDSGNGDWRGSNSLQTTAAWGKASRAEIHSLWYQQSITLPVDWTGQRILADFRRIEGDAIVFVNGRRIQELLRPGGEVDLTPGIRPGQENILRVFVTRSYQDISRDFEGDPLRYSARKTSTSPLEMQRWSVGITGPVTLMARPKPAALSDVFVKPSWRQKSLTLDFETDAATATQGLMAVGDVVDSNGKTALTLRSQPFSAAPGKTRHEVTTPWANPVPWELDGGVLYTLRLRLESSGRTVHALPEVRFGFREVWSEGRTLLMNGHPIRLRLASLMQGGERNLNALQFFKSIGYNAFVWQDNPTLWWRDWAETPLFSEETLNAMDEQGLVVACPAPSINNIRGVLLNNPRAAADFDREMALFVRRYRNHPSILAWTIGMNAYNPRSAIAAQGMGRRETSESAQARVINAGVTVAKKHDPTRPAYSHADGGTGDIASANIYLNFAPLQEREEWPQAWAKDGDMPIMAAEFGQPYAANFWKGKRFFPSEYTAMYLGDAAYNMDTEEGLRKLLNYGLGNKSGHGMMKSVDLTDYPSYWEFQKLFVRNTNRSWRTWGVNGGWSNWVYDIGYGNPPSVDTKRGGFENSRYRNVPPLDGKRPSWASPNYEIHQQANQPLLAYIGGAPVATDKTHAFYGGETIRKQLVLVWDGPGSKTVTLDWKVEGNLPKPVSGQTRVTLQAGDIKMVPVEFAAPNVTARTELTLKLSAHNPNGPVQNDEVALQVFPPVQPLKLAQRIALYDPRGLSRPWLTKLGVTATDWQPGTNLNDVDLLIVGREALGPGRRPPYTPADIARGLRVLVLEQQPAVWKGLGFGMTDTMPRYTFTRDTSSPILAGLQPEDLINWRGTPNLLPEGVNRPHDVMHAPKWTNRHAVASAALQIPELAGFTPILSCEFDLNYSPLLEMRHGKGEIRFCSLDLTDRVGTDPAATLLARNLLQASVAPLPATRTVQVLGGVSEALDGLEVQTTPANFQNPASGVMLIGQGADAASLAKVDAWVRDGGTAIYLPTGAARLKTLGYQTKAAKLYRTTGSNSPLLRAVGPNLLRWRDELEVNAFTAEGQPAGSTVLAGGLLLARPDGKGQHVFLQVEPGLLANRYADDADKRSNLQTSVGHLRQLMAQILTNAGVPASEAVVERISNLNTGPAYEILGNWQALGPFPVDKEDGEAMLNTKFPGEAEAITGDTNPNVTYTRKDGVKLDWRPTVKADSKGFINLSAQLNSGELAVAYLTKEVTSKTARTATMQLGADYRLQVWVNGEVVFRTTNGRARPNAYQVKVPLKAGTNVLTMKVASGSRGFGVWTALSVEEPDAKPLPLELANLRFNAPLDPAFDPYEFHYW